MALRLVEIYLPSWKDVDLKERLPAEGVVVQWAERLAGNQVRISILLPVEKTETFLDGLESSLAGTEFHAVLIPVEAVIPRPEPKPEPPKPVAEDTAKESPPPARISREELFQDVSEGIQLTRTFTVLVALSALVAAVGIVYDNVTVVIGAMVIAPLLGPNVALALATTLGDTELAGRAVRTNIVGILVALAVAIPIGLIFKVDPRVGEIQSRLHAQLKDIVLALASGSAAVLSFTTAAPAALIGVMVAVALIPPLVTFGLLLGAGELDLASRALLLFITNVICINLAGVVTLLMQDVRPRTWWQADKAKRAIKIAITIWVLLLLSLAAVILALQRGWRW